MRCCACIGASSWCPCRSEYPDAGPSTASGTRFRGRPNRTPCALARLIPARIRSWMRHRSHSLSAARMWICSRPAGVPRSMPVLELQFWKDGDDDPGPRWRARAGAAARQGLGRLAHAAGEEAAVSRLDLYRGAMRGDRDHQGEPHRSAPRVRSRRTRTRTSLVPNPIQDSRDLHPVVRLRGPGECRNHHSLRGDAGCLIRGAVRVEAARPVAAQNAAHRSLQNRRRFRTAPTRLILVFLSEERGRPEPSRITGHRPTDSAEEAFFRGESHDHARRRIVAD